MAAVVLDATNSWLVAAGTVDLGSLRTPESIPTSN